MGVLRICDDNPVFLDGAPLSPTAMNIVSDNLLALDEGTRLGGVAFCGLYGQHPEEAAQQTQVIWRGGGVWRTGMTTLRVTTFSTGTLATGDVLRIYRGDDDTVFTDHTLALGTQTFTPSISSGYTDGQPLRVRCEVRHTSVPADGYGGILVEVQLAEFLPVALPDAAPTNPAFSTVADLTGAKLTQLSDFVNWLIRRVALRYDPVAIWQLRRVGPYCIPILGSDLNVVWRGGLRRSLAHTTLRASGAFLIQWGGATEAIRLFINGVQVDSETAPTALGETAWELTASLSGYADGAALRLAIDYVRSAPVADDQPINRWSIGSVGVDSAGGSVATLTAWQIRQPSVTAASLLSWAQAARALAQTIADRIVANGAFWGVQRLYTARPAMSIGADNSQFSLFEPWSVPAASRVGEALVARGRALSLGYRGVFFDEAAYAKMVKTDEGVGAWPLIHTRTQAVIDGDDVESQRLDFEGVPQLAVGDRYFVRGVESYVLMEQLKVVS